MKQYTLENITIEQAHTHLKWEYQIIPEQHTHPDIGLYCSYSICVFAVIDQQIRALTKVQDITTKYEEALHLAHLCNCYQLSPIHLIEFIQDYLEKIV